MERVFEQLGETDPQQAMKEARREQFITAKHQSKLADIARETAIKDAQAQMQIQMAAQQQMAQQQAQTQQPVGQTPPTGMEGQGANMNAGGTPSGATFEQQRGATRNGTPLPV